MIIKILTLNPWGDRSRTDASDKSTPKILHKSASNDKKCKGVKLLYKRNLCGLEKN